MNRLQSIGCRLEDIALGMREALAHAAEKPDSERVEAVLWAANIYADGIAVMAKQLLIEGGQREQRRAGNS